MAMTIRPTSSRRPAGFTLLELVVAVAIVGILASFAAPVFQDMIVDQRVKSASFDLTAALIRARSEARLQNGSVTLTPASGTSAWAAGWTITGPDGAILAKQDTYESNTLTTGGATTRITITGPTSIVYDRTGRSSAAATVTLEVGTSSAFAGKVSPRCISVGVTGLPKSVKGSC